MNVIRRQFLKISAESLAVGLSAAYLSAARHSIAAPGVPEANLKIDIKSLTKNITDDLIREGVEMAVSKTLIPAATQKAYPGHFTVTADGKAFGAENTWPGLDSWELAGAYLLLDQQRLVLDYFDFVQASQRRDGNIPFAIFPADPPPDTTTHLRGLHYPEDVYTYKPIQHEGQPSWSNKEERKWIGLFDHWQLIANPLSVLGPISYILIADEIVQKTQATDWLLEKIDSIEAAGRYLLARKSANGFISGAGFYVELPPRHQWDGVTQCYGVKVFRLLSEMNARLDRPQPAQFWKEQADTLAENFRTIFWQVDHFAEYIHPQHGVVDLHGLTDVNWAAVAFEVATDTQTRILWPLLMADDELWHGDMPTQLVSKPYMYREWELCEPLPWKQRNGPLYDVAAMGRVWYVEAMACLKMDETDRLRDAVRKVCQMGRRHDWLWHERYHPLQVWDVYPAGPHGYCEFAAILIRIVLGNIELFG